MSSAHKTGAAGVLGLQAGEDVNIEKLHAFAVRVGVELVVQFRLKKRVKAGVVACVLGEAA
tara:strand:+ start:6939 stop:7121 length:183 start_codon:yes stop_codon:yes gene_type:complete